MANKVQYGLKNVHYALATVTSGVTTYGTPEAWPGAVSLNLDSEGEIGNFFADDVPYFTAIANNGYSGDFESALMPDNFRTTIMGETVSSNGIYLEDSNVQPKSFALMFEFNGDDSATKYVLYNCKMGRPSIESATKEDSIEVQTITGEITAIPRVDDGIVKGICPATATTAYAAWYTTVQTS